MEQIMNAEILNLQNTPIYTLDQETPSWTPNHNAQSLFWFTHLPHRDSHGVAIRNYYSRSPKIMEIDLGSYTCI